MPSYPVSQGSRFPFPQGTCAIIPCQQGLRVPFSCPLSLPNLPAFSSFLFLKPHVSSLHPSLAFYPKFGDGDRQFLCVHNSISTELQTSTSADRGVWVLHRCSLHFTPDSQRLLRCASSQLLLLCGTAWHSWA